MRRRKKFSSVSKRKKKEPIIYDGIEYDSPNEWWFVCWCKEAKKAGLIQDFTYHEKSYELFPEVRENYTEVKQLKSKIKETEKSRIVLRAWTYTPDNWLYGLSDILKPFFRVSENGIVVTDTKGVFSQHNDSKSYSQCVKAMYHIHHIFVNTVIMEKLAEETWAPEAIKRTKTGKISSKFGRCRTIEKFIEMSNKGNIK